jgi:hypothetical protein
MVFWRSPNLVALSGLTVNGCFIEIAMSSFCLFHGHYQGLGLPVACLASHLLVTMCEYYDFLALQLFNLMLYALHVAITAHA